jgi:molecular chaperone HtpG
MIIDDASWLLLEQALLIEGVPVDNPGMFVQRLNRVLRRAV